MRITLILLCFLYAMPAFSQSYRPSSLFLENGDAEIKLFNNLYTQKAFFDETGKRIPTPQSTFLTSIIELRGSVNSSVNIGAELWLRSAGISENAFEVLAFKNEINGRSALTYAGPQVVWGPSWFGKDLSLITKLLFPLGADQAGNQTELIYLDREEIQWVTMLQYSRQLNYRWAIYAEAGVWWVDDFASIPLNFFGNYIWGHGVTLYLMSSFSPVPGKGDLLNSYYIQSGAGIKYLLSPTIEVELLYTNFWKGKNNGAGKTFNVGFRYIRNASN